LNLDRSKTMSQKQKKEVRKDERKDVFSFVESLGLKVDETTAQDSSKRLKIANKETAVLKITKLVYDSIGYKEEIKAVRVEGTLEAYSGFISLGDDFAFEIGDKVHWDSNAPESKSFFGTMVAQKAVPKRLVAIHRQDKYSWYISEVS